jgi:hypothetical protein
MLSLRPSCGQPSWVNRSHAKNNTMAPLLVNGRIDRMIRGGGRFVVAITELTCWPFVAGRPRSLNGC